MLIIRRKDEETKTEVTGFEEGGNFYKREKLSLSTNIK